jgi:ubiquinone/menaquinone biosynthesis C-methylase UbiE
MVIPNEIMSKEKPAINPFMDHEIASGYESWYQTKGRLAEKREKELLKWLLTGFPNARTVLEVGCGTGHFTRWFGTLGLHAVGLDISTPMLDEYLRLGTPMCVFGDASHLPFSVGEFDLVALITTLEFLTNPIEALVEAWRVTRQGLILGVINLKSRYGRKLCRQGGPVWDAAHLFTLQEIMKLLNEIVGNHARIVWRTTLWPIWTSTLPLPWGGFIGVSVMAS